jgi:hypothetical protein
MLLLLLPLALANANVAAAFSTLPTASRTNNGIPIERNQEALLGYSSKLGLGYSSIIPFPRPTAATM